MPVRADRKRTVKPAQERREDLLSAAVRVFAAKGIRSSTVADITEAAGVAKGTFYLYFDSKEHLLGALKERFVDEILEHADTLYARVGKDDWWGLVDTSVESFVDFMIAHRDMIHVLVQEGIAPETSPVFAECQRRIDEMFASGIEAGVEAGAFESSDPELTASFLHHALEGAVAHALLYGADVDRGRLVDAAREHVRKILAP